MSTMSETQIEQIVRAYKAKKITGDMLDAKDGIERMLSHQSVPGLPMPWSWLDGKFAIRPGELTLLAGANGSGKSMLAGQIVAWQMAAGVTSVIASMEMSVQETLKRMVCQCYGGQYTTDFARWFGDTYRETLWIWDVQDVVPADKVLERVEAVSEYLDAKIVVIDSLLKCGLAQDGEGYLSKQTQFLDRLQHAAKHLGVHVILVVHLRKPERGQKSGKYDIRGASQISDLADNVLLIHQNAEKREAEQLMEQGQQLTPMQTEALSKADAILEVAKQRHGAWEGQLRLDFDSHSLLFTQAGDMRRLAWPGSQGAPL